MTTSVKLALTVLCLFFAQILVAQIIYVTPDGDGIGTKEDPANIIDAIDNYAAINSHIRLSTGTYNIDQALEIDMIGLILEGGFIAELNWTKTSEAGATTIHRSGHNPTGPNSNQLAIIGINVPAITDNFRLSDFKVIVDTPIPDFGAITIDRSISTYGIKINDCYDYFINRVIVDVAKGMEGYTPAAQPNGLPGYPGQNSFDGSPPGAGASSNHYAGGAPGIPGSFGDFNGGAGGDGVSDLAFSRQGGSGGGGGAVGWTNISGVGPGGNSNGPVGQFIPGGLAGTNDFAMNGFDGFDGADGADGINQIAPVFGLYYQPGLGEDGQDGVGGTGGSGGGAGQGDVFGGNSSGAGGGSGGDGGYGGHGGRGGGGTFGIFITTQSVGGRLQNCLINVPATGTTGALGQLGTSGGSGGYNGIAFGGASFPGGNGGNGGNGGDGGNGVDGPDGDIMALYVDGSPLAVTQITTPIDTYPIVLLEEVIYQNAEYILQTGTTLSPVTFTSPITGVAGFVETYFDFAIASQGPYVCPSSSILYVDETATGFNDGSSWANAFTSLESALFAVNNCPSISEIYVAKGTYKPERLTKFDQSNYATFDIKKDIKIYGGFAGGESGPDDRSFVDGKLDPANLTILNGDLAGDDIYAPDGLISQINSGGGADSDNSIHVVTIEGVSDQMEMDGFAITGGYANGPNIFDNFDRSGAGMFVDGRTNQTDPKIKNCIFRTNLATNFGGGVLNWGNTKSTFENCQFLFNTTYNAGGGAYNYSDAGICEPTYTRCQFSGNKCGDGAAAGSYAVNPGAQVNASFIQCLVTGNDGGVCGGISAYTQGAQTINSLINCTFANNTRIVVRTRGGGSTSRLYNSIVWGNDLEVQPTALNDDFGNGTNDVQNSIVQGVFASGTIYNDDPKFLAPYTGTVPNEQGDYRVDNCLSPAIDLGYNPDFIAVSADTIDLDGKLRFQSGPIGSIDYEVDNEKIDLGPYEIQSAINFTADQDSSDAWIDLKWVINDDECNCLTEDPILKRGITVQLKEGPILIESFEVFEEDITDGIYEFEYRDFVGPNIIKDYILELKRTGPGTLNCRQTQRGKTKAFQQLINTYVDINQIPDSINMDWINKSDLTDRYNIYRNGSQIATINANNLRDKEYTFADVFDFTEDSFVNGNTYTYCIETGSDLYESIYGNMIPQQVCFQGSSYNINLQATDSTFPEKVELTWNDVSAFASQLRIVRDGETIGSAEGTATSFTDDSPIYGRYSEYGVELLNNSIPFVGSYDTGRVPGNGVIEAVILTTQEKVPVENAWVNMTWVEDDTYTLSNTFNSDETGKISFNNLYYGESNVFTLSVSKPGETFEPDTIRVTLSLDDPKEEGIVFFMDKDYNDEAPQLTNLSNFTTLPQPDLDQVDLSWEYQKTDPGERVYFNVYRESNLIYQEVNTDPSTLLEQYTFIDNEAAPDSVYEYSIHAFNLQGDDIIDTLISVPTHYPEVAPVINQLVNVDPSLGQVTLTWVHSSTNNQGFRLYRLENNVPTLIHEAHPFDNSFVDVTGTPGSVVGYYMSAFRTVDGIDYESINTDTTNVFFPDLKSITQVETTANDGFDNVYIDFEMPVEYQLSYQYNGVNIYRTSLANEEEFIGTIDKELINYGISNRFTDYTGIPNEAYDYEVRAYKVVDGEQVEKAGTVVSETFPAVSIPLFMTATSYEGKIAIEWENYSANFNGFVIYKGAAPDSIGYMPLQPIKVYNDYTNNPPNNVNETYWVATERFVNGDRYLSNLTSIVADPPLINGTEAIFLKNFTATRDQANHVKLCWEWCDPATQSPFVIRREGVVIATEGYTSNTYYDYDAPVNVNIEYSIETPGINNELDYQLVYTQGFVPGGKSLVGRAYKQESNIGLDSIRITAVVVDGVNIYTGVEYTNAAGFYKMNGIPVPPTGTTYLLVVYAEDANSNYELNPYFETLVPGDEEGIIEVDFVDTNVSLTGDGPVAEITSFKATPNQSEMAIHLSWSPENENFDGFEIGNGNEVLGEVLKGEHLVWTDTTGIPGILTMYSVRAFKITNTGREYSAYAQDAIEFPYLAPVEYLTATPLLEQNKLLIQWSHPFDNHDLYTVTRNGVPLDVINTGEELFVIDSTGIPGVLYNYEVIAWKNAYQSLPRYISANYTDAEPIRDFDLVSPSADVNLSTQTGIETISYNYLFLTWDYLESAADSFMIIRYIKNANEKLDEQILARVAGNIYSYSDFTGLPNQIYHYEVVPLIYREGVEYYAKRRDGWAQSMVFPTVSPPYELNMLPVLETGTVRAQFDLLPIGVEGFKVYRNGILLDVVPLEEATIEYIYLFGFPILPYFLYEDKTGTPNISYQYAFTSYYNKADLNDLNTEFESVPALFNITYPLPPTPVDFSATDGTYPNKIDLTWTYDMEIPVDEFEIQRKLPNDVWQYLATAPFGDRTYTDFITGNDLPPDEYLEIEYKIQAINKGIYSSDAIDPGSLYSGIQTDGIDVTSRYLGNVIDIGEEWAVAGTEGHGFQIYKLQDDNTWLLDTLITLPFVEDNITNEFNCFGCQVAISGKYLVTSAYYANQSRGAVYVFERANDGTWSHMQTIKQETSGEANILSGFRVDIYDDTSLSGKDFLAYSSFGKFSENYLGDVTVMQRIGDQWETFGTINGFFDYEFLGSEITLYEDKLVLLRSYDEVFSSYHLTGTAGSNANIYLEFDYSTLGVSSLDLYENKLLLGNPGGVEPIVFNLTTPGYYQESAIYDSNFEERGWSASIYGDYAITGSLSGNHVALYHFDGSNWSLQETIGPDPSCTGTNFGYGVKLSESFMMISDPYINGNDGKVVFIPLQTVLPPEDVNATDGTQPGQVLVSWKEPNDLSEITSYSLFRDGDFLASVSSVGPPGNTLNYTDLPSAGLVPGKHYIYQVESTYGDINSKSIGDEGWMPPNGQISGTVTTLQGGAPVEGATVTAELFIDGDYVNYTTTTNGLGAYQINDIYYGEEATLEVYCEYLDHDIISQLSAGASPPSNILEVELEVSAPSNTFASFFDATAYAIVGNVRHMDIPDCFLDSISVTRIYSVEQNGNRVRSKEEKMTDENGEFGFVINPEQSGMDSLLIEIDNLRYIENMGGQVIDSVRYDFDGLSENPFVQDDHPDGLLYITDFAVDRVTEIEFHDQTLYPVTINVVNTCGDALLNSTEQWTIRARSLDGCYERTVGTTNGKTAFLEVPPLDMVFTVTDVSNKSITNLVYLDYLINNPSSLAIDSFHIKEADALSQQEIIEELTISLEYHKPAVVQPDMSEIDFLCDDITRQGIVTSGEEYTIPIAVAELFLPTTCFAKTGYLKVINGASADTDPVILQYDDVAGKFEDYVFTAGAPNPVTPHRWNFKIEYYSDADLFQGEFSHEFFVIGSINLPGNGILVDATDDTDEVPLPLFVLRDPPGDGSYSSIAEGFTSTTTFGFDDEVGGGAGIYGEGTIALFGIGIEGGTEITSGRFNEDSKELSISTFTSKEITTSDSPDAIGRSASVIVGAGVAMQYGIVNSYDIECDGNEGRITETRALGFTPIEIKTTWTYTIQFIEDLIAGYERDLIDVTNGETVLQKTNGDPYTTQEATDKLTALRDNWIQVLHYFDNESNPIYHLTQANFEDPSIHPIISTLNSEANKWRVALLGDIGTDPNVIFDQAKLDKYNNAGTAIRELMNIQNFRDENGNIEQFYIDDALTNWSFSQSRYDNVNYYTSIPGISPNEMAENLTFSGLTSQDFSYGQTKSLSTGSNTNIFFNSDFKIGARFDADVEVQVAPFGIGIATKSIETENRIGAVGNLAYSQNTSVGNENETEEQIAYHLSDDDGLDEISVTVVRGIRPTHTPVFQMVGGKTSCPYEEGTLQKDKPDIQVLDPISGAPSKYSSLFFQDPDAPAEFTIQITNLSATLDNRDLSVFLDNNSNPNGATVKLGGIALGSQDYLDLAYNTPLLLTLTIERGLAYDYTGLRIGVSPPCTNVEGGSDANIEDFITLDVKFQSPCSPISIVKPDNNWLINGENRDLIVGLRDYVPNTPNFESVTLEYRKLDDGVLGFQSGWDPIPYSSIKETGDNNNPVFPDELEAYNTANFGPGTVPTYFMVWEPDMGNSSLFTDGEYELRAVSTCKEGTISNFTYSNYVTGTIDRSSLQVFGTPQPADGVWVPGDEVSVEFTKNIDCGLLDDPDFVSDSLKVFVEGLQITNATFTCFNNKIQMTVPDFTIYDGQVMTVSVENIQDDNGNFALETDEFGNVSRVIEWDFIITTSKAYWEQDSVVVYLYEGETLNYTAELRNTDSQTSLTGISIDRTTASGPWMDIMPAGMFDINPNAVKPIELTFTGLTEGVTYDTLTVANLPGSGVQPKLPIKLVTSKRPPYPPDWTVDGALYPNSMTLVANYKFGDAGAISTDTLDQITVWIDGTLRGLGRIQNIGDDYVAYLTVYGSSSDAGEVLEFRVWDQSRDTEYDAFTDPEIEYADSGFEGSTADPRILVIDEIKDRARYIHLDQGYTWISFNSVLEDMSIDNVLKDVTNVTPGDRILGQDGFAEYIDVATGWFAAPESKLDTFSTEKGYMVFLQNGPDSIRMTGCDAEPFTDFLLEGTNWVGFPSQVNMSLENAIEVNNLSNVEQIKNKDISRISDGTDWTSGLLTVMVPNEGYKLFLSNLKAVTIPGPTVQPVTNNASLKSLVMADPNDETTWVLDLDEYAYTDVIPVVGRIVNNGSTVQADGFKKVAAFINGELRGVADLLDLTELSDDLFTVFIGKDDVDNGGDVDFYYFDGTTVSHTITRSIASLMVNGHGIYNYLDPLIWDIDEDPCPDHLFITLADSPLDGTYQARQTITISDDVQVANGATVILNAPEITINQFNTQLGADIETILTGCN